MVSLGEQEILLHVYNKNKLRMYLQNQLTESEACPQEILNSVIAGL